MSRWHLLFGFGLRVQRVRGRILLSSSSYRLQPVFSGDVLHGAGSDLSRRMRHLSAGRLLRGWVVGAERVRCGHFWRGEWAWQQLAVQHLSCWLLLWDLQPDRTDSLSYRDLPGHSWRDTEGRLPSVYAWNILGSARADGALRTVPRRQLLSHAHDHRCVPRAHYI